VNAVEEFISNLPRDEQQVVKKLRALILEADPRFQERLSYNVPYFYIHRGIFFLWPASAPMGPKQCKVIFGFCYGNLLSNEQGLLLSEGRKQVYMIKYSKLSEISDNILNEIIQEAILVDEQFKKKKKKK
jgi:uncharacterized protein YdhG (YjbR/CyaY superfamily)